MTIDHELRDALRRKEAPANLADRVLKRLSETPAPSRRPAPSSSGMRRWLAAAAVLAIAAVGADRYYEQQRAAEAARVQEELRMALQITSEALAVVQTKLSQPANSEGR